MATEPKKVKKAYRVVGSFVLDRLYMDGETVLYDGEAGANLVPLKGKDATDAEAKVDETLTTT